MTWPMHDAGSTTPDGGQEPPWPEQPGPDEPGPGDGESSRRGRHAAPDPLPPIEGPMPGGGPSPAETTLPLALKWPAPPTRPHRPSAPGPPGWRRVPRTSGYGQSGAPQPGTGHPGTGQPGTGQPGTGQPPRPQPTFTPTGPPGAPGPPGPPGPPGGPGGPGGPRGPADPATAARHAGTPRPAATQRSSLIRSGAGMAVGTLFSRGTGFLRTLVLVYAV